MSGLTRPLRRGVWRYLSDRDILMAAAVTVAAFVLSGGLLLLAHLVYVVRHARGSACRMDQRGTLLVFGRQLVRDAPEADFVQRLAGALANARDGATDRVLILGGASGGIVTEAEAGRRWLHAQGWPAHVPLLLETLSIDSLENLRHAREILREEQGLPPVWLLTSRYHLARCLYLARRLGFRATPIGAEPSLPITFRYLRRLLMEAGYLMWIDTGMRWAALTGNRRMDARIR